MPIEGVMASIIGGCLGREVAPQDLTIKISDRWGLQEVLAQIPDGEFVWVATASFVTGSEEPCFPQVACFPKPSKKEK